MHSRTKHTHKRSVEAVRMVRLARAMRSRDCDLQAKRPDRRLPGVRERFVRSVNQ